MGCMSSKGRGDVSSPGQAMVTNPAASSNTNVQARFQDKYEMGAKLGEGAFAIVKECSLKGKKSSTGMNYAAKIVTRANLKKDDEDSLRTEVAILRECDHPNIVNCIDFHEEKANFYIIMEKCNGGELFDRIVAKVHYSEAEARGVVKQLLASLDYLHSRRIVHRDLKPENLLLAFKNSDDNVKLADFGFACKVNGDTLTALCGTPGYVAPEVLSHKPYGVAVDMWSIGVIIYIILGGYPPFSDANQKKLFEKIKKCDYEFHDDYWGHVSGDAKDLIKNLLVVDKTKRLTARQALQHGWLSESDERLSMYNLDMNLKTLKKFNARRKFKAGIKAIIATKRFETIMASFKEPAAANANAKKASGGGHTSNRL